MLLVVGIIIWFPVRYQFENLALSVRKLHVNCEVNVPNAAQLEVFYNDGNGWHSSKRVIAETERVGATHTVDFPVIRIRNLEELRLDVSALDTLVSFNVPVIISAVAAFTDKFQVDVLTEADLTSNCLDVYELENGGIKTVEKCEDAQLTFKANYSVLGLDDFTTKDHLILIVFALFYVGLLIFLLVRMPFYESEKTLHLPNVFGALLFLLFISSHWYFLASSHTGVDPAIEKRRLSLFPSDITEEFALDFESWFEDHCVIRQALTRIKSLTYYYGFNKSALENKLVKGLNGQLFPSSEFLLDDFMGDMKLNDLQKISIHKILTERINYMKTLGGEYFLLMPPSKQTIYPEDVPFEYRKTWNPDSTMLSQLMRFLMVDTLLVQHVCDPRAVLIDVSKTSKDRLYFDSDIHWNGIGAYYGYQSFFNLISRKVSELKPFGRNELIVESRIDNEGDLARLLMMQDDLPRLNYYFSPINGPTFNQVEIESDYKLPVYRTTIDDSSLPKALVFRDSYCQDMMQFVALHFSDALFVWDQEFDVELIKEQQPDIVIQEVTEMLIYDLLRVNPESVRLED
jgi:hypothetical protein